MTFAGPALDSPDPLASGSSFTLTLYDATVDEIVNEGVTPNPFFAVDPSGAALVIDIQPDGDTVVSAAAEEVSVGPPQGTGIPEPATLLLVGLGGVAVLLHSHRHRHRGRVE